jgi:protein-L-isoaspartate(D-aspartate) O-methyltransferase
MTEIIQNTAPSETAKSNKSEARFNMPRDIARFNMIEQQIRTWEVLDPRVLTLLNEVPREHFVPSEYAGLAFADIEIPLGYGQSMLQPKLEARLLQALDVQSTDYILHVGTGSGYFTALLASLARHVVSLEINSALSAYAASNLKQSNIHNVTLELADGAFGRTGKSNQAFYDVIVYTASSPVEPAGVRQQLNIGGRMLIVLGSAPVMQATLIQRVSETGFKQDVLFETCIPELMNAPQADTFKF